MDFARVKAIEIPEGNVKQIKDANNNILWQVASPSLEYIQDGLVAWYDAENNTGNGHVASTNQWKNLAGNDYAYTYNNSNMSFNDNYISFTQYSTETPEFAYSVSANGFTFEVVCVATYPIGDSQAPLLSNFSGVGYGIQNATFTNGIGMTINTGGWHDMNIVPTNQWNTSKIYTITGTYDNTTLKGYADGTQTNSETIGGQARSDYNVLRIFGAKTSNYNLLSGKVYCVRCYNRALTSEEVAHNRAIDLDRFGT